MQTLNHPDTGKSWSVSVTGETVSTVANGRSRTRTFADEDEARHKAVAETWAKLKAGFVFTDPDGVAMLRHAGKGVSWLGQAAVCASEENEAFYVVSAVGGENRVRQIGPDGTLSEVAVLEGDRLVRSISWYAGFLFADVDGRIFRVDVESGETRPLTDVPFLLGGSLRIAGSLAVWHDGRDAVVTDLDGGREVWRREVQAGQWAGHTPMLSLAVASTHVAWCVDEVELHVVSLASGEETLINKPEPELTDQLWLTEGGHLFAFGPYSTLSRYSLVEGRRDWRLSDSGVSDQRGQAADVAMDRARKRLAVMRHAGAEVLVLDATSLAELHSVSPEYVVRSGASAFTRDGLAVLTDFGCVARYSLHD